MVWKTPLLFWSQEYFWTKMSFYKTFKVPWYVLRHRYRTVISTLTYIPYGTYGTVPIDLWYRTVPIVHTVSTIGTGTYLGTPAGTLATSTTLLLFNTVEPTIIERETGMTPCVYICWTCHLCPNLGVVWRTHMYGPSSHHHLYCSVWVGTVGR